MSALYDFILGLSTNTELKKRMPSIGSELWERFKLEASCDSSRIWTEHEPPIGWDTVQGGVFASAKNGSTGITDPVDILPLDNDRIIIVNYNSLPAIYTYDGLYIDTLPYGRYTTTEIYRGYGGGDIREFGAEKRVAICNYAANTVVVYDHNAKSLMWSFGSYGHSGNPGDGYLYYPRGAVWLPNGNLLVACYSGTGDSAIVGVQNSGYLVELNGSDGSLIAVRMVRTTDNRGQMSRGGCFNPANMARGEYNSKEYIYICNVGSEEVGMYEVDDTGLFEYYKTFKKPTEVEADAIDPWCCCPVENDGLCVYSGGMRAMAAVGIDSGAVMWATGMPGWDNRAHPRNEPHELDTIYGMIWDYTHHRILAADYGNKRVMALDTNNYKSITYQVTPPPGYELDVYPRGFDPTTYTLTVPVNEVKNISYSCRKNKAGHLVLGWRKLCS